MTIALIGLVLGAVLGWFRAGRAKGNRLDRLQYAAVYGIIFGLLGFIIAIIVVRGAS